VFVYDKYLVTIHFFVAVYYFFFICKAFLLPIERRFIAFITAFIWVITHFISLHIKFYVVFITFYYNDNNIIFAINDIQLYIRPIKILLASIDKYNRPINIGSLTAFYLIIKQLVSRNKNPFRC